ncbi:hypothetical protein BU23DRAFT_644910 [Bimuria novae-zelandiae CBS 107.79]|uniref:Uncharacterized protein n=1 Tax=Bimuria novae-zelandiae CBS 107.79 TaxID=1447943 RepID=A0A6A5V5J9_9PLEO|nr:hypothetical protein BU23DRAFT_644910 [Bimuria novae-zelandiae CBS 107.79]
MRYLPQAGLPMNSSPSDLKLMKQLLEEKEALIASLKLLKLADEEFQEHLVGSFIFALIYTNALEGTEWRSPPNIKEYDGLIWQEKNRWIEVPQAISWNGISPLVTGPGGIAQEQQVAFEKEWRRFLNSPGRNTVVRYFSGGETKLQRKTIAEAQEVPLVVHGVTAAEDSVQVVMARSAIENVTVAAGGRQWLGVHPAQDLQDVSRRSKR